MHSGATARSNEDPGQGRLPAGAGVFEPVSPAPFAWQYGRRLWILDGRDAEWILAELVFEPLTCRYFEVRRARYRWPREAACALLGRALAGGLPNVEAAARGLALWSSRAEHASRQPENS